jgi:hypothetical protein
MRTKAVYAAAAFAMGLSGCSPTASPPIVTSPSKTLTIAQVAGGDFTNACSRFAVAVGYYRDVSFLMPAEIAVTAAAVVASGNAICSANPTNVSAALAKLDALWVKIQALTTVPK